MPFTSTMLRQLRERTPLTVREVAAALGFDGHSRYAYYESPRFKGFVPVEMARRLAAIFARHGIPTDETMRIAGLHLSETDREFARISGEQLSGLPEGQVLMPALLPSEASLIRMFHGLLTVAEVDDPSDDIARTLAVLFPSAFAETLADLVDELAQSKPSTARARSSRSRAKEPRQLPPA